jgi:hypothetical protein
MGGSSKTESSNTVDPQLMALYQQNYATAQSVANTPFQPYTGERVASFSPLQQTGQQNILAAANDPTATNTLNAAIGGLNGAMSAASGLSGYHAQTVAPPPTVTPTSVAAGQLSNTDLTPYLNPYTDDVVNSALADLARARGQQQVTDNESATAAHAFGGTRQAVLDANSTDNYLRNVASTTAGLRQTGYATAQQAALADIGNRLGADQFNATNRLGADQFNATGAYNAGIANATNDLAGANLRLNAAGLAGNQANMLGGLSGTQLDQALQRANAVQSVGAQQTAQQQSQDDAAYEEFLRQLNYPYQQQQLRNQAVGMIPLQQTQTQTTSSSPGVLDVLNTAANLGSAAAAGGIKF